jgi:hypothetical protein
LPASASVNPAISGQRRDGGVIEDPVESALAAAIGEATKAGRWDVVAQLAKELEIRRTSRTAPNVVTFDRARERR